MEEQIPGYEKFKGHLGDSAEMLAACLRFDADVDRAGERLGVYAFLKTAEDQGNSDYQRMKGRYQHAATKAAEARQLHPAGDHGDPAGEDGRSSCDARELAEWKLALERILRYRPHTLSDEGGAPAGDAGADVRGVATRSSASSTTPT